jgi:hypothetical protein
MDGSVTTMAGDPVLPADPARAEEYKNMSPNVAKWMLPDGGIVGALPVSWDGAGGNTGGGTGDGVEVRPTIYNATCSSIATAFTKVLRDLPDGYVPHKGDIIFVNFLTHNNEVACYFQILGSTKIFDIYLNGSETNLTASAWRMNSVCPFYFDGSKFHQIGSLRIVDDDTTNVSNIALTGTRIKVSSARTINYYMIVLERTDGTFDSPLTSKTSTDTAPVNANTDFKVDGLIWYRNASSGGVWAAGSTQIADANCASQCVADQNIFNIGFNGSAHLKSYNWIYLVGIPQDDPMVYRLDPGSFTSWYTTEKPTTEDGKVYIRFGYYSALNIVTLFQDHPAYWFKNGYFRPYLTT